MGSVKWIRIIGGLNSYTVSVGVVLAIVFLAVRTTMRDQPTLTEVEFRIGYFINKAFALEETVTQQPHYGTEFYSATGYQLSGYLMNSRTESPSSVIG